MNRQLFLVIITLWFSCYTIERNFVTACDMEHFPWLISLIQNIRLQHKSSHFNMSIFDLGLTNENLDYLKKNFSFTKVLSIEMTHPDLLKKFVVRKNGRVARGLYAWKPVVLHQACQMFEYFIYLDSGIRIMNSLDNIFKIIKNEGCFLVSCGHAIEPMTTNYIKSKFDLSNSENNWILKSEGLSAGIQGISRLVYDIYIKPIYEMAYDLKNFEDDGSAPWGFGGARHDQTIFSILAVKLGLKIHSRKNNFDFHKYFRFKSYSLNPGAKKFHLL